jgi:glycoside/pentoside/hexuronide:cation symporter, GPH family
MRVMSNPSKEQRMQDESKGLTVGARIGASVGKAPATTVQSGLKKLSLAEKVGFSLGDAASNIFFQTWIFFSTIFYTDVVGLLPESVSWMLLITKVWDAIMDPVVGMISDRTETRWGKFRPFILVGAVPLGILGVLSFTTPNFSLNGKLAYVYITYALVMTAYSVVNVPYSALMGVMTPDSNERTVLSSFRFFAAFFATLLVQYSVLGMVKRFGHGSDAVGWQWAMTILCSLAVVLFFITFAMTKERVHPPRGQKTPLKQDLADLFTNVPWVIVGTATIFQLVFYCMRGGAIAYYFKYFVKGQDVLWFGARTAEQLNSAFLVAGTGATLVGVLLATRISRAIGKSLAYALFLGVAGVSAAALFLLGPQDIVVMFALQIIASFSMGPVSVLQWSIYTDAADFGEWKVGRRSTALIMAASLFALKFGAAVGNAAVAWILGKYGFQPNVDQTAQALTGIRMVTSVYPAVFAVLAMLFMFFYPLNKTRMAEVQTDLIERRKQSGND